MAAGVYVLEVTVADLLTKKKPGSVTEWADFEIVP